MLNINVFLFSEYYENVYFQVLAMEMEMTYRWKCGQKGNVYINLNSGRETIVS